MTLPGVAEEIACATAQTYSLVRSGTLPAIKIGGRGQWRVSRDDLEDYLTLAYKDTRAFIEAHPLGGAKDEDDPEMSGGQ